MPTKFNLSSNQWILLSIVLLVSSSYPYKQLTAQKSSIDARAKSSIQKAITEENNARVLEADFRNAKTTQGANSTSLTVRFQEFLYGIKNVGARYNVDITTVTVKDGNISATSRELGAVAVPLAAAPGIKVITIELRGKVKSIDDLRNFLDFLSTQQLSIANLSVNRDFFITVDMYGV